MTNALNTTSSGWLAQRRLQTPAHICGYLRQVKFQIASLSSLALPEWPWTPTSSWMSFSQHWLNEGNISKYTHNLPTRDSNLRYSSEKHNQRLEITNVNLSVTYSCGAESHDTRCNVAHWVWNMYKVQIHWNWSFLHSSAWEPWTLGVLGFSNSAAVTSVWVRRKSKIRHLSHAATTSCL